MKRTVALVLGLAAGAPGAVALAGCGAAEPAASGATRPAQTVAGAQPAQAVDALKPHPRVVDPSAGVVTDDGDTAGGARVDSGDSQVSEALPQPRSDAEIRRELAKSGIPSGDHAGLTADGLAIAPLGAPAVVQTVIDAGNQIARLPYRYGGGHATFIDTAYDCSASLSFAFAAAGLISSPMDSTALSEWGDSGPGRWITIFANGTHTFMYIAGLRFDTGGLSATGSRWQGSGRDTRGFVVRHPAGL
jgi:cell wall-associated NlpC family hydrolase